MVKLSSGELIGQQVVISQHLIANYLILNCMAGQVYSTSYHGDLSPVRSEPPSNDRKARINPEAICCVVQASDVGSVTDRKQAAPAHRWLQMRLATQTGKKEGIMEWVITLDTGLFLIFKQLGL